MRRTYNFGLLFEEQHNQAFTQYSQAINGGASSDFCLGDRSLPHLTVLQFDADVEAAESFWERLKSGSFEKVPLNLVGLTLIPTKDRNIWVEIAALKDDRLMSLQKEAMEIVGNTKIHNGTGNAFRPHITVARVLNSLQLPNLILDENVVRRKNVTGRISLGVSGQNYQYEEILFDIKNE